MNGPGLSTELTVICRIGPYLCALPGEDVEENMRPLPIEPLAGMPDFVLGLSLIRGRSTPVVDAGRLLGVDQPNGCTRFLVLKVDERRVALAVETVVGIRDLAQRTLTNLPPLLREAGTDIVSAIGTLDSEFLLLLHSARLIPGPVWEALEAETPEP